MHPMIITGRGSGSTAGPLKGNEPWRGRLRALREPSSLLPLAIVCAAQLAGSGAVRADPVLQTMNGVPLLPMPTIDEVGLPAFTMPTGTVSTGNDTPTRSNNTGSGSSGDGSDRTAMATMMSRSWGAAAEANAQSLGVNGTALAATCVLESNCQSVGGTGTINGAFQMSNATFTSALAAALQRNPSLAANIVPGLAGKMDPATQSIAAAEYLREGAVALQAANVPNPSVLDVRGYYNFGPGNASGIALAQSSAVMSDVVPLTAKQYEANGIIPGVTTIGQWRDTVTAKVGQTAAQTSVLLSPS